MDPKSCEDQLSFGACAPESIGSSTVLMTGGITLISSQCGIEVTLIDKPPLREDFYRVSFSFLPAVEEAGYTLQQCSEYR